MTELEPTLVAGAVLALLALFLSVYFLFLRRRSRGNSVLIVGASDAGKTALFSALCGAGRAGTVTSMKENVWEWSPGVRLVDVPGSEKLRPLFLEQYKGSARGVVFVVDAGNLGVKEAAQALYDVLLEAKTVPVLVVANKQDLATAKSSEVVKTALEKEVGVLNKTRASALDDGATDRRLLGEPGREWHFGPRVEFAETSALGGEVGGVEEWLRSM